MIAILQQITVKDDNPADARDAFDLPVLATIGGDGACCTPASGFGGTSDDACCTPAGR